jgi:sigma-54 dependent transcriptional regulator, acetoin dehydrogenase operon transcriptional activator AcoR
MPRPRPPTSRLERRRIVDRAWQVYVQDGIDPAGLSPEILRSWRRAKEALIDPAIGRPIRSLSPEALEARRQGDPVLAIASPILRDFASCMDLSGHVLAYLDGEGWMLTVEGDRRLVERLGEIGFRPGVNWAEDSAATNGPGTALAEGKPIEVFASEHYVSAWQPWSCSAAPVQSARVGRPLGLIDITGPWEMQRQQALLVARTIARAVEERFQTTLVVRDEVVRHCFLAARNEADALVGVDSQGLVLAANEAATRRRLVEAGSLPASLRDLFPGLLSSSSRRRLEDEFALHSPDGYDILVSPVCFGGSRVGAILRADTAWRPGARAQPPRQEPRALYQFAHILGESRPLRQAVDLAKTASRNGLPVVLTGESGTGKELFAQAIHAGSERRSRRFVAVNCGSIPAQLVEAELFGYEAGSFTGARREGNPGRFEDADGGTLFLDEVSELSAHAQTALLRVLQEHEVVRLGGSSPRRVDVRVVAASNKSLEDEVQACRFRRDLYYRLHVFSIAIPALRERDDDISLLAQAFLAEAQAEMRRRGMTLAPGAVDALRRWQWPGNVRELRNVIVRAVATAPGTCITADDLALEQGSSEQVTKPCGGLRESVLASERSALVAALESSGWNFARTAHKLGISRMTLYRRLRKCGISRSRPGEG